ncbi:eCIS core domain-containing protein [Streptomyces sp. NPDC002644]
MRADRQQRLARPDERRALPRQPEQVPVLREGGPAAAGRPGPMSPGGAGALQRTIGNAAVVRRMERERHRHGPDCRHATAVQRLADDEEAQTDAVAQADAVTRTAGSPMRADVRRRMEGDFGGEDFGDVRVHVDRGSAEALGAKAYTTKTNRIVFRSAADMDDHTLRHELQHVRQQRAGGVPTGVSHPTDALERDAESTAAELGRQPQGVQRATAAEHPTTRPVAATARAGVVQRVLSKTTQSFFQTWAGAGSPRLNPEQKNWVWKKLIEINKNEMAVKRLTPEKALAQLAEHDLTPAAMDAEIGSASTARQAAPPESMEQYQERAEGTVRDADRIWRERQPDMPRLETRTFDIEGLGRGTVAMLKSASAPRHPDMLAWFSHGYEDKQPIAVGTPRQYGFAVQSEQSLNRVGADAQIFASLPDALANAGVEPTGNAPGEYVQPHHATELSLEIDRVTGLVDHCDVAVLLDFQWSDQVADAFAEARKAETPPLAVIVDQAQALNRYTSLLIYACRTPWSVNAAAEGSSKLKASLQKELMSQGGLSAAEALAQAQEKYEGSPQRGKVYR